MSALYTLLLSYASYYEGGTSSVYTWDLEGAFAAAVLIKKGSFVNDPPRLCLCSVTDEGKLKGAWDSIHVFEVTETGKSARYQLTSTIMLYVLTNQDTTGIFNLAGNMTRQVTVP